MTAPPPLRGLAIAGTDTGVGKTRVSAALMAATEPGVRYWKPLQTGTTRLQDADDDTGTVVRDAELSPGRWLAPGLRLPEPASPHHAAALAGATVSVGPLMARARAYAGTHPDATLLVEGAGGLLVPLNGRETLADLYRALGLPIVVVAHTRLGAIHHTLATLAAARASRLEVAAVVASGPSCPSWLTAMRAHAPEDLQRPLHLPPLGESPTRETLAHAGRALLAGGLSRWLGPAAGEGSP